MGILIGLRRLARGDSSQTTVAPTCGIGPDIASLSGLFEDRRGQVVQSFNSPLRLIGTLSCLPLGL